MLAKIKTLPYRHCSKLDDDVDHINAAQLVLNLRGSTSSRQFNNRLVMAHIDTKLKHSRRHCTYVVLRILRFAILDIALSCRGR